MSNDETIARPTIDVAGHTILACVPVYNESQEELTRTVDSFRDSEGQARTHLTIVVDGPDPRSVPALEAILGLGDAPAYRRGETYRFVEGVLAASRSPVRFLLVVKDKNGGKRDSHALFLKLLRDSVQGEGAPARLSNELALESALRNSQSSILLVDSDTSFPSESVGALFTALWQPRHDKVAAAAGFTFPRWTWSSPIEAAQHFEYWYTYMSDKAAQSTVGFVACVPGNFAMYKSADVLTPRILDQYLRRAENIFDFNKLHLGEDRYLTTLLLRDGHHTIFVPEAKCDTTSPATIADFLSQRRRWVNSKLVNDMEIATKSLVADTPARQVVSGYMRLSALVEALTTFTWPAFAFALASAFINNFFGLSAAGQGVQFAAYNVLFAGLLWTMSHYKPSKSAWVYYGIFGLFSLYNLFAIAMAPFVIAGGGLSLSYLLIVAGLAVAFVSALHVRAVQPSLAYCFAAFVVFTPAFVLAPLFAYANIDDISWGTRGHVASDEDRQNRVLQSAQRHKKLVLFLLISVNLALSAFLVWSPAVSLWLYFGMQIILWVPRFVLSLAYAIKSLARTAGRATRAPRPAPSLAQGE